MDELNDQMLDEPVNEERYRALQGPLDALLQDLAAARPASAAPGSEVTAEMRLLIEDALGSAGGEMVSFDVGAAPSPELMNLHAKIICMIVRLGVLYPGSVSQEALDYVKSGFRPDDLPPDGKPNTSAQLVNWCVRQMVLAHQQGKMDHLAGALLLFLASHGPAGVGVGGVWVNIFSRLEPLDDELIWAPLPWEAKTAYRERARVLCEEVGQVATPAVVETKAKTLARLDAEAKRVHRLEPLVLWALAQLGGPPAPTDARSFFFVTLDRLSKLLGSDGRQYYLELLAAHQA